jgi:hypothetical protein
MTSFTLETPGALLRRVLLIDAATCAVFGVVLIALAPWLAAQLLLPELLLFYAGLILLPVAVLLAVIARQPLPRLHAGGALAVAGNAAWVVASIALLVGGWVNPNLLGTAFVVLQAAAVAAIVVVEYVLARRLVGTVA